jgi:hypothetical protein
VGFQNLRSNVTAPTNSTINHNVFKLNFAEPISQVVKMCSPALCPQCSKVTSTGCGGHIEEALEGVPQEQRCTCND